MIERTSTRILASFSDDNSYPFSCQDGYHIDNDNNCTEIGELNKTCEKIIDPGTAI